MQLYIHNYKIISRSSEGHMYIRRRRTCHNLQPPLVFIIIIFLHSLLSFHLILTPTTPSSNNRPNIYCHSFIINSFISLWGSLHKVIILQKSYFTNPSAQLLLAFVVVFTVFRCILFAVVIWKASVSAVFIFNQGFCHNRLLILKITFYQYVLWLY